MDRLLWKIYIELPPKECFYSSINDGKRDNDNRYISDEQYLHLKNVCNTFNFNTFRGYHNHSLKKDVLLLADVFEKFIFTTLKKYNLDPCHCFSAPGLSWDAILKMTEVELEKNNQRWYASLYWMTGGISYVAKRYSKARQK